MRKLERYTGAANTQCKSSKSVANVSVLEMKIWIYWSDSNSWIYFIYIYIYENYKKFTSPNKELLVLATEDCRIFITPGDLARIFITTHKILLTLDCSEEVYLCWSKEFSLSLESTSGCKPIGYNKIITF